MSKTQRCIMLVDDNKNDNFFHEREIKKNNLAAIVISMTSGKKALTYLRAKKENKGPHPDVIFLDVNMPDMNGWEFLQEYNKLDKELQSQAVIIMLTTFQNEEDKEKSKKWSSVSDYISKPLTKDLMKNISAKYFIE